MPRTGTTNERGYGTAHQAERARWQVRLDAGEEVHCAKCSRRVYGSDRWHLGHTDDRTAYTGPEHELCNVEDGARRAHEPMIVRDW